MPTINIRLFAVARQIAGRDSIAIDLPPGGRVRDLREQLGAVCPDLSGLSSRMLFAVNAEYAADDLVVPADAEVACIPPVSGGAGRLARGAGTCCDQPRESFNRKPQARACADLDGPSIAPLARAFGLRLARDRSAAREGSEPPPLNPPADGGRAADSALPLSAGD